MAGPLVFNPPPNPQQACVIKLCFVSAGQADVIEPVRKALAYYTEMQQAIEDGKKHKENGSKQNGITT